VIGVGILEVDSFRDALLPAKSALGVEMVLSDLLADIRVDVVLVGFPVAMSLPIPLCCAEVVVPSVGEEVASSPRDSEGVSNILDSSRTNILPGCCCFIGFDLPSLFCLCCVNLDVLLTGGKVVRGPAVLVGVETSAPRLVSAVDGLPVGGLGVKCLEGGRLEIGASEVQTGSFDSNLETDESGVDSEMVDLEMGGSNESALEAGGGGVSALEAGD
jgi:hypothetical protein